MADKLRAAVIGTGMGRYHMEAYARNPKVDLVAVCDLNGPEAQEFATKFGAERVFTDWREMYELDLDLVSIAVPNNLHAEMTVAALERGFHVLCEKPMATKLEDARRMVETAERVGKRLMIHMSLRYQGAHQHLKSLVAKGDLGDIYLGEARMIRRRGTPLLDFPPGGSMGRGPWFVIKEESGGGAVMDIGVHTFDLVWWLMGCPKPVAVSGATFAALRRPEFAERKVPADTDEHAAAFVALEGGRRIFFEACWASNQPDSFTVELFGTQAGARLGDGLRVLTHEGKEPRDNKVEVPDGVGLVSYDHFVEGVLDPSVELISEGWKCLPVAQVLDALDRSAALGSEVVIEA
ncbi:MAG: Gfo/Idh/MocA family oxidoreductase [Armatimonadetes bacterium]|jgi:predicted dehydrogenase|nr:Gfo/Idh/MocA family oxidoreductase [Armatimonadota bacterium]MDI9601284.1 Gfo/Idh/MocA family oxidoreductase [Acidobacteriota bacterium]NLN91173.1 Gfo/Idh/MocA family oxidoreductase [candidate division WS1 bacterium]